MNRPYRSRDPKRSRPARGVEQKVASAYIQPPLNKFMIPRPSLPYLAPLGRERKRTGPILDSLGDTIKSIFDNMPQTDGSYGPDNSKAARMSNVNRANLVEQLQSWDPHSNFEKYPESVTKDPFKTLFIGRLSYMVSEQELKRVFWKYGPVKSVHLILDKQGRSRGYGFVEFEHRQDLLWAYDDADGMKLEGRKIVVDLERGRTMPDWRPRRLGGGIGNTRKGSAGENRVDSGRPIGSSCPYLLRDEHGYHAYKKRSRSPRRDEEPFYRRHDNSKHSRTSITSTTSNASVSSAEEGELIE
jgi:U1 small nuclear ribonucleoprotein